MHFSTLAVVACAASANAFKNTSPFLMFSNKQFPDSLSSVSTAQLQSSSSVLQAAKDVISRCDSEKYYIISQPELTASSLTRSSPHLRKLLEDKSTKSHLAVSEVVGFEAGDREELVKLAQEKCGAVVDNAFIDRARYGAREMVTAQWEVAVGGWTQSEEKSGKSDPGLQANVLKDLSMHHSYTFILLSTPATRLDQEEVDNPVYEAIFDDAIHMDLKRNLNEKKGNSTSRGDQRPLFEKYQFLTPGLFMGLLVGIILLSILGVGLNAIANLQVSYGAFEKEMGPQGQKKQQ